MEEIKLPTQYQEFIHLSRYARWNEELGRRETWQETVARYFDFMQEHLKNLKPICMKHTFFISTLISM